MGPIKRALFRSCVLVIRGYQRLFMTYRVIGQECIPPGPKLFVSNHISAFDGFWVLPALGEPVHVVVGAPYAVPGMAWLCRRFEQINALAPHRATVVDQAVARLGEDASVYICPEGDFHEPFAMGRFYPGAARIYRRTRAAIVPIALVAPRESLREYPFPTKVDGRVYRCVVGFRGPFMVHIGEAMHPAVPGEGSDDQINDAITQQIKDCITGLVEAVRCAAGWD